jgi:hypothetical protein
MNEALGYAASIAVLATFLMQSMGSLRLVAILSNVLFVSYGYFGHILPVLLLHSALLPINIARLATCRNRPAASMIGGGAVAAAFVPSISQLALFALGFVFGSFGLLMIVRLAHALLEHSYRVSV